jgi:hypothetical protein
MLFNLSGSSIFSHKHATSIRELAEKVRKITVTKKVRGQFFVHFFPGKILPQKCLEKMEFSAEKVLKNRFSKKFRGIFRGKCFPWKKCTKNRPQGQSYDF